MHILDACVSDNTLDIYGEYITEAYKKRNKYKTLMNKAKDEEDMKTKCKYDLL